MFEVYHPVSAAYKCANDIQCNPLNGSVVEQDDMADVVFFSSKPVRTGVLSSPRMTVFDFMASLGGIVGLLMGVSFISIIAIANCFTVKLAEAAMREKESRKGSG